MTFHRQPQSPKCDYAQDIRDFVNKHSDDKAKLETLERLSRLDLTVLALAFGDLERKLDRRSPLLL